MKKRAPKGRAIHSGARPTRDRRAALRPGACRRAGLLCKEPPYGGTHRHRPAHRRRPCGTAYLFGSARGNGPFGIPSRLPIETEHAPTTAGRRVTAGGVSGSSSPPPPTI
ncbi:hypothetical protein ACRAWD_14085 [Caulobacter segnis]